MTVPLVDHPHLHPRPSKWHDLGWLLVGAAALIVALAVVLYVLWMIVAQPKATGFDSDGVRCYRAASEMTCIKTAEPPR